MVEGNKKAMEHLAFVLRTVASGSSSADSSMEESDEASDSSKWRWLPAEEEGCGEKIIAAFMLVRIEEQLEINVSLGWLLQIAGTGLCRWLINVFGTKSILFDPLVTYLVLAPRY